MLNACLKWLVDHFQADNSRDIASSICQNGEQWGNRSLSINTSERKSKKDSDISTMDPSRDKRSAKWRQSRARRGYTRTYTQRNSRFWKRKNPGKLYGYCTFRGIKKSDRRGSNPIFENPQTQMERRFQGRFLPGVNTLGKQSIRRLDVVFRKKGTIKQRDRGFHNRLEHLKRLKMEKERKKKKEQKKQNM